MNKLTTSLLMCGVCISFCATATASTLTESIGSNPNQGHVSINAPQSSNSHHKVSRDAFCTYVSFGPSNADTSIYRVQACTKTIPLTPAVRDQVLASVVYGTEAGYGQPMKRISSSRKTINGHPAYSYVYSQRLPHSGVPGINEDSGRTLTHAFYIIDYGRHLIVVDVQTDEYSKKNKGNAFLNSIRVR